MAVVDKDLCDAYRKGCQETVLARMGSLSERVDAQSLALVALSTKVDLLKVNDISHLTQELNSIRKARREPLGNKEWAIIISAFLAAVASVIVALVGK